MSNIPIAFAGIIAENYEKYFSPIFFTPTAKDIVSRLRGNPGSILEIACGTGQVTRLLKDKFPDAKITATDFNPDMISVAKKAVGEQLGIKWMAADACELPFDDNSFDAVICQFGIMFFPDKQKAVNEAYRVLRPGGKYIFNTWDKLDNIKIAKISNEVTTSYFKEDPPPFFQIPFSMYEPAELEKLMKGAGFKNVSAKNVQLEGTSPDAEGAAIAFTAGNPIYTAICERDESLLPEIQKSVREVISKEFGTTNLRFPLSLFVTEGSK